MVTAEELRAFATLFRGYDRAYGQYDIRKAGDPGRKNVGKPWTVSDPPTEAVWRDHLDGTGPGLGIILLQGNDTCRFGAIDVDDYNTDHNKLVKQIEDLKLPLVVCRTKSGGAHLYVFFFEDVPATVVRDRLSEWCAALGLSAKTEQFPKQINRANDNEIGNWINLPFYDAERTMRYAIRDGAALSLSDFLAYAQSKQVGLEAMSKPFFKSSSELFYEGPPCLITLESQGGFMEGTRNQGMFAVAVYCRKRFGDDWEAKVDEYNRVMANLPSREIAALVKNVSKKDYTYPCKQNPINSVCQRRICLGREYGIGDGGTASSKVEILSVIRYDHADDNPLWSFEINGRRVMVDNDTFYSRDALNRACMAQAGCVPLHMAPAKWLQQLNELVQSADIVPMPDDASPLGQLWERIEMFLQQGVNAMSKEEVVTGKVWRDKGYAYFRSVDLFSYLDARRVKYKNEQFVWQLLRKKGAQKEQWNFGKKGAQTSANVWFLPYTAITEELGDADMKFGGVDSF